MLSLSSEYRNIFLALAILAGVALGSFLFFTRQPDSGEEQMGGRLTDLEAPVLPDEDAARREVQLFFCYPQPAQSGGLSRKVETRQVAQTDDVVLAARRLLQELVHGPGEDPAWLLPPETQIRGLYFREPGWLVVDFDSTLVSRLPGSALEEWALVQSITQSLVRNLEEVEQVQILVEGQERETLGGHVSLAGPFR